MFQETVRHQHKLKLISSRCPKVLTKMQVGFMIALIWGFGLLLSVLPNAMINNFAPDVE